MLFRYFRTFPGIALSHWTASCFLFLYVCYVWQKSSSQTSYENFSFVYCSKLILKGAFVKSSIFLCLVVAEKNLLDQYSEALHLFILSGTSPSKS